MDEQGVTGGFDREELRGRALERLQGRHGKLAEMPTRDLETLVHELEVYQVELEVQNEELRRAQVELAAALERYRDLYDRAPMGYLTLDPDGRVLQCNHAAARLFAREREDLEGKAVSRLILNQDADKLWLVLRSTASSRRVHSTELQILRPASQPRWVHIDVAPLDAEREDLGGFRLTLTDITARVLAEDALRESETKYRIVAENNYDWEFWLDPGDRYLYVSPSCERVTGHTSAEFLADAGLRERLIHLDDREAFFRHVRECEHARQRGEGEWRIVRPDGSARWIAHVCQPVFGDHGAYLGCRGSNRDVSEHKLLDQRLAEAQKMEAVGLLARGIAHDFNNLLVGVIGNASLLQETVPESSPAQPLLARIISAGQHAAALTQQLLAYAGRGTFELTPIDVSRLVREGVELLRSTVPNKVEIRLELADGLPPVRADGSQIEQVFMNLVLNAAEAIGPDPGVITVTTGTREILVRTPASGTGIELQPGTYVVLEVSDTGCGMDEQTRARIFDPFFTTKFIGRGLGLAAVSGIVRVHDGSIEVSSEEGRGSRFTVLLPAAHPGTGAGEDDAAPVRAPRVKGAVLIVDDEEVVRDMAAWTLSRQGYEVLLAESGPEALDRLRDAAERTRLVILDLGMPGMGGEEVLPRLRQVQPGVKVLISSGYPEAEVMRVFGGAEVAGFIQKPFTAAQLTSKIEQLTG